MKDFVSVMISYDDTEYDENGVLISKTPKTIYLIAIEDVTVNKKSELTTHPLVSGDMAADHMIRQPSDLSINGEFSINGSDAVLIDGTRPSIKDFQSTFERINEQAFLCSIVKLTMNTDEVRFLQRQSMALTSISWTERINSVRFTFSFDEVPTTEVQTYDVDLQDENLPAVTNPSVMSFTSTMIDWTEIDTMVGKICDETGLTTKEFWDMLRSFDKARLASMAIGAAATIAIGLAALNMVPVFGQVATAVIVVVAAVAIATFFFVRAIKRAIEKTAARRKYRLAQFEAYKEDAKNVAEVKRYAEFVGNIHIELEKLNNALYVYQVSSNEPQECMLTIDDEYYVFMFTKNNAIVGSDSVPWDVTVTQPQNNDEIFAATTSLACAKNSYDECTTTNCLFRASGSGAYVYMMYIRNEDYEKYDLRNYYILVSGMDPQNINKAIEEIINNAILY